MKKYKAHNQKVPRFTEANGFYTTKSRSELMRKIRSKDTNPEIKLRHFLWGIGIRYRKNVKGLPGTPDVVVAKYKLVVFVDGEFWHGHNWEEKREKIKSNRRFWIPKIERNIERDLWNTQFYKDNDWTVFRFWEHEIKKEFSSCINEILSYIDEFEKFHVHNCSGVKELMRALKANNKKQTRT